MPVRQLIGLALAALLAASCSEGTGPEDGSRLGVQFDAPPGARSASAPVSVTGLNGTVTLTDVRFIVAELELELADDDDCDSSGPGNPCEQFEDDDCDSSGPGNPCNEFEAPPSFVRLPLDGGGAPVIETTVPPGVFEELEFEIEDLDDDDGRGEEAMALRALIRSEFPDWPDEASMVLVGTFTPAGGGSAIPFRVFVDAEIEVEMEFDPPLVVDEDEGRQIVIVELDLARFLRRSDGTVIDLSRLDFGRTRRVADLEVEIRRGFTRVRH